MPEILIHGMPALFGIQGPWNMHLMRPGAPVSPPAVDLSANCLHLVQTPIRKHGMGAKVFVEIQRSPGAAR
jgi:hypothetical protein